MRVTAYDEQDRSASFDSRFSFVRGETPMQPWVEELFEFKTAIDLQVAVQDHHELENRNRVVTWLKTVAAPVFTSVSEDLTALGGIGKMIDNSDMRPPAVTLLLGFGTPTVSINVGLTGAWTAQSATITNLYTPGENELGIRFPSDLVEMDTAQFKDILTKEISKLWKAKYSEITKVNR